MTVKLQVVNNQRISVTQRQSVLDALKTSEAREKNAAEIERDSGKGQTGIQYLYYCGYAQVFKERRTHHAGGSGDWYSSEFKAGALRFRARS